MNIECLTALQQLESIKNRSNEILKKVGAGTDLNTEVERIKGYMTDASNSSDALREYLEKNKTRLEDCSPPSFYKS